MNPNLVDCSTVDPVAPVVPPVSDPPSGGLPAGGEPGQALVIGDDGKPTWAAGGGSGVTLYNTTGQSTTGGMTQKAITDELNGKASTASVTALANTVSGKADQTALEALQTAVDGKADASALAAKADNTALEALAANVANKADTEDVNQALSLKADKTAVTAALANKVDKVEGMGLSANSFTDDEKAKLDSLVGIKDIGSGLVLSSEGVLSATGGGGGGTKVFVAEYGKTTAQEINAYIASTNEPFAPIVIKRGDSYFTSVTAQKTADNRVILRSFATLSGDYYMFTYTVTDGTWAGANYGFQKKLVSGTDIKTINGESLLGAGDIELATAADLAEKQDTLTAGTNITITKDAQTGETTISATGTSITVDDALDEESTNPVQNRILYGIFESQRQVMQYMQDRIVALEDKLKDFEEIRLQMSGGGNVVDKTILAKPYVSPITNMFELPERAPGTYDADGNLILAFEDWPRAWYYRDDPSEDYWAIEAIYADKLPEGTKGIVLPQCAPGLSFCYELRVFFGFVNATSAQLDWLVIPDSVSTIHAIAEDDQYGTVVDFASTIYYRGTAEGAPWGQTGTTFNTTGVPLAWA